MADIIIRDATLEDAKACVDIYAPYVKDTAITYEYEVPTLEEFKERIRTFQKDYPYLVAEKDGEILGYSYAHKCGTREAYCCSAEWSIYIRKDSKRLGIGRALSREMDSRLAEQGVKNVYANVSMPNGEDPYLTEDSYYFHKSVGFREVGLCNKMGTKFGRWYDRCTLEKFLGPHHTKGEAGPDLSRLPKHINAVNFAPFPGKGTFEDERCFKSADLLIERLNINSVILTPSGLQETAQSETITWDKTVSDDELVAMIDYFHQKGIKVLLKPTVNCKDGTWRGHIAFFDEDVVCEPKWTNWFKSYSDFMCHYAKIARDTDCEMFIAGCEMVQTDKRAREWRKVIADIRNHYQGPVSYNCDKYQEEHVTWWDAVDIISSSGYYPIDDWDRQMDRIKKVVNNYDKPFFFAETGCMSVEGSQYVPNNWGLEGDVSTKAQADWYEVMMNSVDRNPFVMGTGLWSWAPWSEYMFTGGADEKNGDYELANKPAESVVSRWYKRWS